MSDRCQLSGLLVGQCACRVHAPEPNTTGDFIITARFPARFDSECDNCGNAMDQGDPIARTDDGDYICGRCAS